MKVQLVLLETIGERSPGIWIDRNRIESLQDFDGKRCLLTTHSGRQYNLKLSADEVVRAFQEQ